MSPEIPAAAAACSASFSRSNCVVSPDPSVAARLALRWAAMPRQWRKDLPGALPFSRVRRVRSCALVCARVITHCHVARRAQSALLSPQMTVIGCVSLLWVATAPEGRA